ncbi:MAG: MBL fold metallo-hydrolase [Planctomycetales bacterium]|nr:MBL fold metallo-hydrolase [bacterium]UNM07695.1 MAG: MBL fold metallo-hydrolase [Planctomycetales bacterium]
MRIHHLTAGYFRPPLRGLTQGGKGAALGRGEYVIHCLLVELGDRLLLVDTGLGRRDMDRPLRQLGWGMAWFGGASNGASLSEQIVSLKQNGDVAAGLHVTDIIMTHLDGDHTGGLADFPDARVHVNGLELEAWRRGPGPAGRQRYVNAHFAHGPDWLKYREFPLDWFGFAAARLEGLPDDILLVSLPGHTLGHCGIAIETTDGWQLHAGDAAYHSAWLKGKRPPLSLQIAEHLLKQDPSAWRNSLDKLIALKDSGQVTLFTSHDPEMFAKLALR